MELKKFTVMDREEYRMELFFEVLTKNCVNSPINIAINMAEEALKRFDQNFPQNNKPV